MVPPRHEHDNGAGRDGAEEAADPHHQDGAGHERSGDRPRATGAGTAATDGDATPRQPGPTTTVWSPDRSLSVHFAGAGELVGMSFTGSGYRQMAAADLAALIVRTMRAGRGAHLRELAAEAGSAGRSHDALDPAAEWASPARTPTEVLDLLLAPLFGAVAAPEQDRQADGGPGGPPATEGEPDPPES